MVLIERSRRAGRAARKPVVRPADPALVVQGPADPALVVQGPADPALVVRRLVPVTRRPGLGLTAR
jgi:hypothetical protein